MRVFLAAIVIASLAGPALAQSPAIPKYGEVPKEKSQQELAAERQAEQAYQKSLGRIPEQKPTDPWGSVRSDSAPKTVPSKTVAKDPPAKRAKVDAKVDGAAK